MGVKLGLDAVLSGNPTSICKTKVQTVRSMHTRGGQHELMLTSLGLCIPGGLHVGPQVTQRGDD